MSEIFINPVTAPPRQKQKTLSSFLIRRPANSPAPTVEDAPEEPVPMAAPPIAAEVAMDNVNESILDEIIANASGLDDVVVITLTPAEVHEHVLKELRRGKDHSFNETRDLYYLMNYTSMLGKEKYDGSGKYGRIEASLRVAEVHHEKLKGVTLARYIRALFLHYRAYDSLPIETRGGKRNGNSFLDDELVFNACRSWLLNQAIGSISAQSFQIAFNEEIAPRILMVDFKPISLSTIYRWLPRLGFTNSKEQKGVYIDGHERPDVVAYRDEVFLPMMKQLDKLSVHYIEDEHGILTTIEPELLPGQKRHVFFFHDESCFHAFDFRKSMWLHHSQQKIPRKGGKGKLIHVSDFIGPEGRITSKTRDARVITYPGKNGDPWWNTTQLVVQIKEALDIFEEAFPGCVAVLVFDQSSAHNSHGEGALNAWSMNLNPGGKAEPQNDTYYPPESRVNKIGEMHRLWKEKTEDRVVKDKDGKEVQDKDGKKVMETITFKEPKGIKRILQDRGCYPEKHQGQFLRAKCVPQCPDPTSYPPSSDKPPCCLTRILQNHQDFREAKPLLEQLIEDRGHRCLFLPKFHCELNPIEMNWGYAKARFRQVIKQSFDHAKKEVIKALDAVSTPTLRRFCNKSFRFMDAYRKKLPLEAAAWCVRKQKGHRAISERVMKLFEEEKGVKITG